MNNLSLCFSKNTMYLTDNGFKKAEDIVYGIDSIYYLDDRFSLNKTLEYEFISSLADEEIDLTNYRDTNICIGNRVIDTYKSNEITLKTNKKTLYKSFSVSSKSLCDTQYNDNRTVRVDINDDFISGIKFYDALIFTYFLQNYSDLDLDTNSIVFNLTTSNYEFVNMILKKFLDLYGINIPKSGHNAYSFISKSFCISEEALEEKLLNNIDYIEPFISRLHYLGFMRPLPGNYGSYSIFFKTRRQAIFFQSLLTLCGYKTYVKYSKNSGMFFIIATVYKEVKNNATKIICTPADTQYYYIAIKGNTSKYVITSLTKRDTSSVCISKAVNL